MAAPGGELAQPPALRVHRTIGAQPSTLDLALGAGVHIMMWGGGMFLGPLALVGLPFLFATLPLRLASSVAAAVLTLVFMPALPESPKFCHLVLRTAALIKGGSTLWVADPVLPHISDNAMVCYHPHGVVPLGFVLNGAVRAKARRPELYLHEEAPISHRVSGVQAPVLFRIPLLRQFLQMFGCTVPATKKGMYSLFAQGMTFGIVVGGSEEVALHIRGRERLYLKDRAGFLKYALQYGYKVIVAYNFGECDLYQNVSLLEPLNLWLVKRLGFVLPVFWGRWWCPLLPRGDVELHTVFGELLQLPKIEEPSAAEVNEWHQKYIEALTRVFERYKGRFGYADRKLEIL